MSKFCAKCNSQILKNLKRCSRCKSISYCSKECQFKHWKSHKRECQQLSSDGKDSEEPATQSEGPTPQSSSDVITSLDVNVTSESQTPRPERREVTTNTNIPNNVKKSNDTVWGVKIFDNKNRGESGFFETFHFPKNHKIFELGELCAFTVLYGIPVRIYSPLVHGQAGPEAWHEGNNQRAVYLCIEPDSGFAPVHWQMNVAGTCYAIRDDKQPLSKELLETMFEYHSSLLGTDFFEKDPKNRHPITPTLFQKFSDKYWEFQKSYGRKRVTAEDGC